MDELDAERIQALGGLRKRARVLARDACAHDEHVRPRHAEGGVCIRAEALVHPIGHNGDAIGICAEHVDDFVLRELGHGDDKPRAAGDPRQQRTLVGHVGRAVPIGVAQGGNVVDHHHVAVAGGQRGEVGG